MDIPKIGSQGDSLQIGSGPVKAPTGSGGGFADVLEGLASNLESAQAKADVAMEAIALGEDADLHDVVIATEVEALSIQLALQTRNRLVETFNTVFNMHV